VFSIRDVPIIYHPMHFIKAKNSRQLGNKDTAAEIGKLLLLQNVGLKQVGLIANGAMYGSQLARINGTLKLSTDEALGGMWDKVFVHLGRSVWLKLLNHLGKYKNEQTDNQPSEQR